MAKTADVIELLKLRYPSTKREWATIVEFQNIDFLAVSCWPSKRFAVHGHEIKISRSDWLREIKKPGKAVFTMPFCDYWWLVAPVGVAKMEEVPDRWGFIEITEMGDRVAVKAERLRPEGPRNRLIEGTGKINPDYFAREGFAMMARRYAYARADRDALLDAVDNPEPYLNAAAQATGRVTSDVRRSLSRYKMQGRKHLKKLREDQERHMRELDQ